MADTVEVRLESGKFAVLPDDATERPAVYSAGETFEVDADALEDHPHLTPVDDLEGEDVAERSSAARQTESGDADESEAGEGEFDAEAFTDRTPMGDVVSDIEDGEADDHLDAVEEAAGRAGVRAAVRARRDELGEGVKDAVDDRHEEV